MFKKSALVTSDQLETFRTPPELQEVKKNNCGVKIKNYSWFYIRSVNWQFSTLFWSVKYTGDHVNPWYQHRTCILIRIWCVPSFKTIGLVKLICFLTVCTYRFHHAKFQKCLAKCTMGPFIDDKRTHHKHLFGREEEPPLRFFEDRKMYPNFEKNVLTVSIFSLNFPFEM